MSWSDPPRTCKACRVVYDRLPGCCKSRCLRCSDRELAAGLSVLATTGGSAMHWTQGPALIDEEMLYMEEIPIIRYQIEAKRINSKFKENFDDDHSGATYR